MRRIIQITVTGFVLLVLAFVLFSEHAKQLPQTTTEASAGKESELVGVGSYQAREPAKNASSIRFQSMTAESGIEMVYYGSPSAEKYMTEQNGGGVALLDFDHDGRLDLLLVNGSHFQRPAYNLEDSSRLYRAGAEAFRFDDVTSLSGLSAAGFGMGCASADYNNDGFTDLFIAFYGRNQLWLNNGDGTFNEVSGEAGVEEDSWSSSAAFADFDSDGDLDLYVVNYVDWSPDESPCFFPGKTPVRISCSPMSHAGQADHLYDNQGDGSFQEIGKTAGVTGMLPGKGLGVAVADFNGDQRLDIYVANDMTPNFLLQNIGKGKFRDVAVMDGVATSEDGTIAAGMGVAVGDYNGDGYFDIFVTNFKDQFHDAFENLGGGGFIATNWRLGLDSLSRSKLAFGIVLADFDLDFSPDLFVSNGHVWDATSADSTFQYAMRPSLYRNDHGREYQDVSQDSGEYFGKTWVGRAAAAGDLDSDGDTDLVVTHLQSPPAILQNTSARHGSSATIRLVGTKAARQPLGIRVVVSTADREAVTQIPSGGSFQAGHDERITVAVGDSKRITRVEVHWSADSIEIWENLLVSRESVLIQGRAPRDDLILSNVDD